MIATIVSSVLCMSLPYEAGLNGKHLAWAGKFYSMMLSTKAKTPNSFTKLAGDFKLSDPQKLFSIPYRIASETYVWSFQYRMLIFMLFTSSKLLKIGLSDLDKCSFCVYRRFLLPLL